MLYRIIHDFGFNVPAMGLLNAKIAVKTESRSICYGRQRVGVQETNKQNCVQQTVNRFQINT